MSVNQTDPMLGRLIDGRYQVRSRIARGGMATVYLASDLRLERLVAVKIMHGHLADDQNFKERFIQEARSAARLAHPNVVNVFDQGQDDESAYLVMEYLPGITLRELLHDHKVLTPEQASDILEAVLAGLAAAHKAGIVHRDLKPENVLLADDGRIKIGDFGLARAASANTATGAALLGTIAYLSPELVTRGIADTRSDIYALGIMLYEMLTGEQPYKGDQPMQIAYQHANDTVPMPSAVNARVPEELDELVLWATARDPEDRPRDARVMLDHLYELQRGLVEPGTHAIQKTMVMPPALAAGPPLPTEQNGATGDTLLLSKGRHRTGPVVTETSSNAQALERKAKARRSRGRVLLVVVVILAFVAGGIGLWFGPGPGGNATVPSVAGSSVEAAKSVLVRAGFSVPSTLVKTFDAVVPSGQVTSSQPASGAQVRKGSRITLIVSQGPKQVPFPDVVGQQEAAARSLLRDFTLEQSRYEFADNDKGIVLSAAGKGADGQSIDLATPTKYGEKQPVTLTVSSGPIPDVSGKSLADAQETLKAVGLVGTETSSEFNDSVGTGLVIRYAPAVKGVVTQGDTVNLVISRGPMPITIPNVTQKTIQDATTTLQNLGFKVSYKQCQPQGLCDAVNWKSLIKVASTSPAAGAVGVKGDTITLSYNGLGIG